MSMTPLFRIGAGLTLLLLAATILPGQTKPSRSDVQNWNDVQITVPVTKTVDFVLLGVLPPGSQSATVRLRSVWARVSRSKQESI